MDLRRVPIAMMVALLSSVVVAKRYCKQNTDCSDLGDLECIKSMCDWGVCGCPHGRAAKFLGTSKLFQCVKVKKVGQECSNDEDNGVCGALNSHCDETTGKCRCNNGYVPVWGGERCAQPQRTVAGETCSEAIGKCELDTDSECSTSSSRWHQQVKYGKPTCACSNSEILRVTRRDFASYSGIMPYVPAIEPGCYPREVGDICVYDDDCMDHGGCVNNKCMCKSGYVKSYNGQSCWKALAKGDVCTGVTVPSDSHCDGSLGLVCGDACYVDVDDNDSANDTCKCGPYHTDTSGGCDMRAVDSQCYGDFNCKGISLIARCDEGKCKAE